jgi:hypothetical protein
MLVREAVFEQRISRKTHRGWASLSELEEARQLALRLGQASAASQASMSKAKLLGLVIDRREVGDEPPKLKPVLSTPSTVAAV